MYAGLTISDKPALLDAKARGAEWVARDADRTLCGYAKKPSKRFVMWGEGGEYWDLPTDQLESISYDDTEPVNIDLALAQIAEMESAEKPCPYCSTDAFSPRRVGLYGAEGFNPFHIYLNSGGNVRDGEQFDFCPKCAKPINRKNAEEST